MASEPATDRELPAPTTSSSRRDWAAHSDSVSSQRRVRDVRSLTGVKGVSALLGADEKHQFSKAVFQDRRWNNGLSHVHDEDLEALQVVDAICHEGAATFGFWRLSPYVLKGIENQLTKSPDAGSPSPTMAAWLQKVQDAMSRTPTPALQAKMTRKLIHQGTSVAHDIMEMRRKATANMTNLKHDAYDSDLPDPRSLRVIKWGLSAIIFIISNAYAIKVVWFMYDGIIDCFGWPVYFARMGGMGAALWTGVLYITMLRKTIMRISLCIHSRSCCCRWFIKFCKVLSDSHKDLHIMAGRAICITGLEHILAHSIGTVPGMLKASVEEINRLIGCANMETTSGFIGLDLSALHWPRCPLESKPGTFTEVLLFTMPGLTGVLLSVLLFLTFHTFRMKASGLKFEYFWYLHNITVTCWPVLLFLHGSNGWIGVGVPLVVFTAGVPVCIYLFERLLRTARYYFSPTEIVESVLRLGKNDDVQGALTYIRIRRPAHMKRTHCGMYAFLCMPEYSAFQWHPFTICSGKDDETIGFLISGVGDWTRQLAQRCRDAGDSGKKLPKIAIDGPYAAPGQTALENEVFVAIGAGVGITPFLSMMATIIANLDDNELTVKEVHFYWMTRSADEFLFGSQLFTKMCRSTVAHNKIILHLHVTATEPAKDPCSFMFREALRRQSRIDREIFRAKVEQFHEADLLLPTGPEVPWCWVNGTDDDVLWVSSLCSPGGGSMRSVLSGSPPPSVVASHFVRAESDDSKSSYWHEEEEDEEGDEEVHLPVVFGRPNFSTEIRTIGKNWPGHNINIYICGNDMLVKSLQEVCTVCNKHAAEDTANSGLPKQSYKMHYERFG